MGGCPPPDRPAQDEAPVPTFLGGGVAGLPQGGEDAGGVGGGGRHRGREQPQAELLRRPRRHHLGQQGDVVAPQAAGGGHHPHLPEPAADVVDQVGQRLGHALGCVGLDETEDVGRGAARLEGPPHRRLGEAEDRRRAAGLQVGHRLELGLHTAQQLGRGEGGEVGLDHEVRGGRGDDLTERGPGAVEIARGCQPPPRAEGAQARHPQQLALLQGPADEQPRGAGTARPQGRGVPGGPGEDALGRSRVAGRSPGQGGEDARPAGGGVGLGRPHQQGRDGLPLRVEGSGQADVKVPPHPGRHQVGPAAGAVELGPLVVSGQGQHLVGPRVDAHQPGHRRQLDDPGRLLLGAVDCLGRPPDHLDSQSARLEQPGTFGRPPVDDRGDVGHQPQCPLGGGPVDGGCLHRLERQ